MREFVAPEEKCAFGTVVLDRIESVLYGACMPVALNSYNLGTAEKALCVAALDQAGSIVEAARLLGITRHALKRRILKHEIAWPPSGQVEASAPSDDEAPKSRERHSEPSSPAPRFL